MRIVLLGLGLIGGSIARALRAAGEPGLEIVAWSPTGRGARAAADAGVVDRAAPDVASALEGADLVVIAGPPLASLALVDDLAGSLRSALGGALVTDVTSTKAAITARAAQRSLRFVGGHPMAGRDTSGFAAAQADLFTDRPWVVVPDGAPEADVAAVEALARSCRARPIRMAAQAHDEVVAAISHLPLLAAAALVEAVAGTPDAPRPDWPAAAALAATGWRDATRLARGDVAMGAGIAATNAKALARRARDLRAVLDGWIAELERDGGPDTTRLEARLGAAREVLGRGRP
jgi:prephenate dehydrogenase